MSYHDLVDGKTVELKEGRSYSRAELSYFVDELVARRADVIVAFGHAAIDAARKPTARIPIVMVSESDPVAAGFIETPERPGGLVSGINSLHPSQFTDAVAILRAFDPSAACLGYLWNAENLGGHFNSRAVQAAAEAAGMTLETLPIEGDVTVKLASLESALDRLVAKGCIGFLVFEDFVLWLPGKEITSAAQKRRLIGLYPVKSWIEQHEALMTFGPNTHCTYALAADFVARLYSGVNISELAVVRPKEMELNINLRTARKIGVEIPEKLIERAAFVYR